MALPPHESPDTAVEARNGDSTIRQSEDCEDADGIDDDSDEIQYDDDDEDDDDMWNAAERDSKDLIVRHNPHCTPCMPVSMSFCILGLLLPCTVARSNQFVQL